MRPIKKRRVRWNPKVKYFKPRGVPLKKLKEIELSAPEFEALRLVDYLELSQEETAKKMDVSQPTLSRILKSARNKLSKAIIEGKAIKLNKSN